MSNKPSTPVTPVSPVHTYVVLRPPPGARFTVWGSDVHIQYEKGKGQEVVNWLRNWIDAYVAPVASKELNPGLIPSPETEKGTSEESKGALPDPNACTSCGKPRNFTMGGRMLEICADCYDKNPKP